MGGLQKLTRSFREIGVKGTLRKMAFRLRRRVDALKGRFDRFAERRFDRRFGVDTCGSVAVQDLGIDIARQHSSAPYAPSPVSDVRCMLKTLTIDHPKYTFIDFGSGKGRVLLLASEHPFKRIVGAELSPRLHRIAERNLRRWNSPKQRCFSIESVCADARDFELPDDPLVLYFYTPFDTSVASRVVANIRESLRNHPRDIQVLYTGDNPGFIETLASLGFAGQEIYPRRLLPAKRRRAGILFAGDSCHPRRLPLRKTDVDRHGAESKIADECDRLVGGVTARHALGNLRVAGTVCQLQSSLSRVRDWCEWRGGDESCTWSDQLRRWEPFRTHEKPQFVVRLRFHGEARRLAAFAHADLARASEGRTGQWFTKNGFRYAVVNRGVPTLLRIREGELEILLTRGKHSPTVVDVALRHVVSAMCGQGGGFLCHAAGVVHQDRALLFFGVSGSGKSTIARLSGTRAILSDECVAVKKEAGRWLAFGTPFSQSRDGVNIVAGLGALIKLTQSRTYGLRRMARREALSELLKAVIACDFSPEHAAESSLSACRAAEELPVYELAFRPEPEVWPFVLEHLRDELEN